jgi:hypothetical protein
MVVAAGLELDSGVETSDIETIPNEIARSNRQIRSKNAGTPQIALSSAGWLSRFRRNIILMRT